jgi:MFS family permease
VRIVGFLVGVEIASGVLQGYYVPIWTDIAGHLAMSEADVNWFEAAQLIVAALAVPPMARLGDMVGHKRVLVVSTAATAIGSWILVFSPNFVTFLIGFAVQGAYIVWLPMEISIIHRRTAGSPRQHALTRNAAAVLVGRRRPRTRRHRGRADQRRARRVDLHDTRARAARDRRHHRAGRHRRRR